MIDDPIVKKVREVRHQIERDCGNDADGYYRFLISAQEDLMGRLVRRSPQSLPRMKKAV